MAYDTDTSTSFSGSRLTVERLIAGRRIVICAGAGGVGKTTTAAALALGMAARGRRVAVVTIDPAPRLATALGLTELDNEPRLVDGMALDGELWAMRLDPKRTFDGLIERLAPDPATRDEIFANRIYQQLSGAVAGSQEFTAIAKLYELDQEGGYDLLVLDTPPSRNALDFLDAPDRVTHFFHGRALRMLLGPGRLLGRGTSVTFSLLKRVTGVNLLDDLAVFFRSIAGLIDGFTERADRVAALLADPGTTFLIVTSPQHEPIEEAAFFHRKLGEAAMPFGGVIVNRFRPAPNGELSPALAQRLGTALARRVSASNRELTALAARDRAGIADIQARMGSPPAILVPELDADVHDLAGLARVERYLFEGASSA